MLFSPIVGRHVTWHVLTAFAGLIAPFAGATFAYEPFENETDIVGYVPLLALDNELQLSS